jgi:lipoprotein-anchoring transpeptidase ErfK/SrfK
MGWHHRGRGTKGALPQNAQVSSAALALTVLASAVLGGAAGCHRQAGAVPGADGGVTSATASDAGPTLAVEAPDGDAGTLTAPAGDRSDKPLLGVTAFVATVYKEPRDTSKKLGYLRVGTKVARSAEPAGKAGCPGGWYAIEPRGYVCAGEDATTDLDNPLLKAERRPDLKAALPYRYAFVRAVLPMYVRVPTAEEQYKAEFKLKEHLDWYKQNEAEVTKVALGADDVALDARGVPLPDKKLGELGLGKNSQELSINQLLGGDTENDPVPFWLEGGKRLVPNISDYKIKGFEVFADRARRHTGLSLIGSFVAGAESLSRRFAVTTDLRLVPATKIKPDMGSPWHGVELGDGLTLPLAFVRSQSARSYKMVKGKVSAADTLDYRSVYGLAGTMHTVEGTKYYRTLDKHWLGAQDVGLAVAPATWPDDAEKGKKWVEISITNQTLVLWEGKKPVYATLVSTGQAGLDDPKHSTATVRGTFHIRNKHISAMMDSNESSSVGGHANTTAKGAAPAGDDDDKADKPTAAKPKAKVAKDPQRQSAAKGDKGGKPKVDAHGKVVPRKGDGEYGVTRRRGEGTFQLRDVPYIQYFENGYALHAAYWHDVFGTPRSHGCVNLAPVDAHRIFFWTDPPVPDDWHAVLAGEDMGEGTLVVIHE